MMIIVPLDPLPPCQCILITTANRKIEDLRNPSNRLAAYSSILYPGIFNNAAISIGVEFLTSIWPNNDDLRDQKK